MNHQKFANFILRQIKDGNEVKLPNISRTDYEKIKELLSKEEVEFDDVTQTFKPKKSASTSTTSTVNENTEEQVTENKPQKVTEKEEQEQQVTVNDSATVTTSIQPQQVDLISVELEKKNETVNTQESTEHNTADTREQEKTTFVRVHLIMSQEVEEKIKEVTGIDRTTKAIYYIINEYFKSKGLEEPFKVRKEKKGINIFEEM